MSRKNKRGEFNLTIESVAIYIIVILFAIVIIYLILRNRNAMEGILSIIGG